MNFYGWHRLDDINKYFENLNLPIKITRENASRTQIYCLKNTNTLKFIKFSPIPDMCGALLLHCLYTFSTSPLFLTALDKLVILTGYSQLLCYWSIEENGNPSSLLENGFKIIDTFHNFRTNNTIHILSKKYEYVNKDVNVFEDHFNTIFKQSLVKEKNV